MFKFKSEKYDKMAEEQVWEEYHNIKKKILQIESKQDKIDEETKEELKNLIRISDDIREYFVKKYAPLVKYVAGRLANILPDNVEFDELISSGLEGLLDAIEKYDPNREPKTKFKTYAVTRIHGQIIDGLREADFLSRSLRSDEKKIKECIALLQTQLGRNPTEEEVADALKMSVEEYRKKIQELGKSTFISLYDAWHTKESEDEVSLIDLIETPEIFTPDFIIEKQEVEKIIREELEKLPKNELDVLVLYYYEGLTLKEIGEVLNLTESRVSQIHSKAIEHLRARLPKKVAGILGK